MIQLVIAFLLTSLIYTFPHVSYANSWNSSNFVQIRQFASLQFVICSPMSDELYYRYHVWHTTHTNDESHEYSVCHKSHTFFHVNFKSDWTNHFILMRCNCIQISFNKYDAYPLTKRRYTVWTLILIFNWDEQLKKWHGHSFNSFFFYFCL